MDEGQIRRELIPHRASGIVAPKWRHFHESLATILGVSISIVGRSSRLQGSYNRPPFLEPHSASSVLEERYRAFRESCAVSIDGHGPELVCDPLALPAATVRLNGEWTLIIGCVLDGDDPGSRARLEAALEDAGVSDAHTICQSMASVRPEGLRRMAMEAMPVYQRMLNSLSESDDLGNQALLVAAIDEICKLTLNLMSPRLFSLAKILDLISSSLIILLGVEGAMASAWGPPGRIRTCIRGSRSGLLGDLAAELEAASRGGGDPAAVASLWAQQHRDHALKVVVLDCDGAAGMIAVAGLAEVDADRTLSLLLHQVLLAAQIHNLFLLIARSTSLLLDSIRDGAIVTSHRGDAMILNQSAATILDSIGCSLRIGQRFAGQGLGEAIDTAVEKSLNTGVAFSSEETVLQDGCTYLSWRVSPIMDGAKVTGALLLFENVTERVQIRRQMQDSERLAAAGEVAAGLAHEIRNPLATAAAIIQLMDAVEGQQKRDEMLSRIRSELDRMNDILTEFLNAARPSLGTRLKAVDLASEVQQTVLLLRAELSLHDIDLVCRGLDPGSVVIMADSNALRQVFLNIIRNAVEAMSGGGRLEIALHRDDSGGVTITFADDGPGIRTEHLDSVLRPFFTTKVGGTGLGLHVSAQLMEEMGGELEVLSEVGRGTQVVVKFLMLDCDPIHDSGADRGQSRSGDN